MSDFAFRLAVVCTLVYIAAILTGIRIAIG
jgi:hypothetical protein